MDQGAIEGKMDVTSGEIEGTMDQWALIRKEQKLCFINVWKWFYWSADGSGSKGWIKEKFEGAMDQGASCSSERNRTSDYYVLN